MLGRRNRPVSILLCFLCFILALPAHAAAQHLEVTEEKILERYKLMLNRKPKEGNTFDRLYQLYLEGAGLERMVADYRAETAAKPNSPNPQLILGHILKRLGRDTEAIAAYKRAIELAPSDYYAHLALGQAYFALRRHGDSITALTQAIDYTTASPAASLDELITLYKTLGRAYFMRNRVEEAISAWGKIAKIDPENTFARAELADLFREQGLYAEAIEQHEAIIRLNKDDPYRVCLSHREIGKIQEEKGDYRNAIQSYDSAIAMTAPGNWLRKDLRRRIAAIFASDGKWQGLVAYYREKLQNTPNDPELISLLALAHIRNQQHDEAVTAYRKGLELSPADTTLRLELIAALKSAERYDETVAEYEALVEMQPDDLQIYRELGELYLQLEDENRAKLTYDRMIHREPGNAEIHLALADIYTSHEWKDDAIAAYEKAVALAPENLDYIQYYGEYLLRRDERDKALEIWCRMVAGDKAVPGNFDRFARLLWLHGFHTDAIAASRKAAELAPAEYRYREALAQRLMENKEYEAALAEFAEASKLAPNEFFAEQMKDQRIEIFKHQGVLPEQIKQVEAIPKTFNREKQLAKMHLKLGNATNAIESLIQARILRPDDVPVNRQLGVLYEKQGLRNEAVAIYERLTEIDAGNAREYCSKTARLQLQEGNFDAAIRTAKEVIDLNPRNPEGHQLLASIERQQENYAEAILSLKQAVRLNPDAIDLRAELAEMYKLTGEYRLAIDQYWRCWDLSGDLNENLSLVDEMAEVYDSLGTEGALKEKLRKLIRAHPADLAPSMALAEVYRNRGEIPGAVSLLQKTLQHQPENPILLSRIAQINYESGDFEEAVEYQQCLIKIQPDQAHRQRLAEFLIDAGREREAVQVWKELLHSGNQTIEADIQLASLLIRNNLQDDARVALNRAGGKVKTAERRYQMGALLVQLNDLDSAVKHFERIVTMRDARESKAKASNPISSRPALPSPSLSFPDTSVFDLPKDIVRRSNDPHQSPTMGRTAPANSAEIYAGALAQLFLIAKQQERTDEFVDRFKSYATLNPTNLQALETLAAVYILVGNRGESAKTINRLIELSPNDYVYHAARIKHALPPDFDFDTAKHYLDALKRLPVETRMWYAYRLVSTLQYRGKRDDAKKLVSESGIMDIDVVSRMSHKVVVSNMVSALIHLGELDASETLLARLNSLPPNTTLSRKVRQEGWSFQAAYGQLADAYTRNGQIEKAIAILWKSLAHAKPVPATTKTSLSGQTTFSQFSTGFPANHIYYGHNWEPLLRKLFIYYWNENRLDFLYEKFDSEFVRAEGADRIFYGLALTCFHWWDEAPDKAIEILALLRAEFPDNLTILWQVATASVLAGRQMDALVLLDQIADTDPRLRNECYNLMLQLAVFSGNTVKIRESLSKLLSLRLTAEALLEVSRNLRESGFTRFAAVAAQRAMKPSMHHRNPDVLKRLSSQLEQLGKIQHAVVVAERSRRLENQSKLKPIKTRRVGFHDPLSGTRFQAGSKHGARLLQAVAKNPASSQARLDLASYYERIGNVEKAVKAFEAAISIHPQDEKTRLQYALMLARMGEYDSAVTQYMRVFKDNPGVIGSGHFDMVRAFSVADRVAELVLVAKATVSVPKKDRPGTVSLRRVLRFYQLAADECTQRNLHKEAAEIYEKVLEVNPNASFLYDKLASAYIETGEQEKAIRFLQNMLDAENTVLSKSPRDQVRIVQRLIELHEKMGTLQSLAERYENRLAQASGDAELVYLVALMRAAAGAFEHTDPLVAQLLADTSAASMGWFLKLGDVYRNADEREREIYILERAIQKLILHPLTMYSHYELRVAYEKLASAYAERGDRESAKTCIRRMATIATVLNRHAENRDIVRLYMRYEMWDEAIGMYVKILKDPFVQRYMRAEAHKRLMEIGTHRNALKQATDDGEHMDPNVLRVLARQLKKQNDAVEAMELYEKLAEKMPEDFQSRAQLAKIYSQQGRHDAALGVWRGLVVADPQNTAFQVGHLNTLQDSGKIEGAIRAVKMYIAKGKYTGHYLRLARLNIAVQRENEAISAYRNAIEADRHNMSAYQELARLYSGRGELNGAEETRLQALRYARGKKQRGDIERELIDLFRHQGNLVEKLEYIATEGILTFRLQWELAQYYRDQGNWDKAAEAYKKSLDMTTDPNYKERIPYALITAYAQLGRHQSALELYKTLRKPGTHSQIPASTSQSVPSGEMMLKIRADDARRSFINAYRNAAKLDDLITYLGNFSDTEADDPILLEMSAEIYRSLEYHPEAAQLYRRLGEIQPTNVHSFYYAAAALNKSDQHSLAQETLIKGEHARTSNRQPNQDTWRLIELGSICFEGDLFEAAIQLIREGIANERESGRKPEHTINAAMAQLRGLGGRSEIMLVLMRAEAHFEAGRYAEAIEAYRQIVDADQDTRVKKIAREGIRRASVEANLPASSNQ